MEARNGVSLVKAVPNGTEDPDFSKRSNRKQTEFQTSVPSSLVQKLNSTQLGVCVCKISLKILFPDGFGLYKNCAV